LLMFSRKQPAQRQLLNLNEVLQESCKMLRVLAGETIHVELDLGSLPPIYADPGMLQQILLNLVANARDAMAKGGHLSISSRCMELTVDVCGCHPEARPGRFVVLTVGDTGCGMDEATMARIFDPFFTTKPTGEGTGLGLATVYGIVKQHQGWVDVTSEPERGTTFRIHFPAASKATENDATDAAPVVRGGHETILIVEDEDPLRELVVEILKQYGYNTIEARNGVEALRIWAEQKNGINLVLTDIMMPEGVSGRDLAEKILEENSAMKVVYTSGYPMDVLGQEFFENPDHFFLPKPYQPHSLARTVRECLDA
jgi:two-component system, cell cycle sensor histidine kinase and response regulator CckA